MNQRLSRSRENQMLGGVCAGLGKYLGIDATWVRIFFVLLAISNGLGGLVYLILWIVLPREDSTAPLEIADKAKIFGEEIREAATTSNPRLPLFIGIGLITLGIFAFLEVLPVPFLQNLNDIIFWPSLLILGGIVLMVKAIRGE
jgi:phage shock protein C